MSAVTIEQALSIATQHHAAGRLAEAETIYRQILAVEPRHVDALQYLGLLALQVGRSDVAAEMFLAAIALAPEVPALHCNLGEAYRRLGKFAEANAALRRTIALKPDFAEAHYNLGCALTDEGQRDEAITAYRSAIQHKPDLAEAHSNLGNALRDEGRLDEATAAYRRAIQIKPDFADAHGNLGIALTDAGRLDEAIAACSRAIELRPDYAAAHSNLGIALADAGLLRDAIASHCRALQLKPDFADARSNLLYHMHCVPDCDAGATFDAHCRWDEIHARPLGDHLVQHTNDRDPERRLRIGYVSPDFRNHPVAFFIEGLLAAHDRSQAEIFCYANLAREDEFTVRLRKHMQTWRSIAGMKDGALADIIRGDGIDILVDLAGHTSGNRLLVFARRPAPVQVTFLGYCDTTGMNAMDSRLFT